MRRLRVWLGLRLDPRAGREKPKGKGLQLHGVEIGYWRFVSRMEYPSLYYLSRHGESDELAIESIESEACEHCAYISEDSIDIPLCIILRDPIKHPRPLFISA